MQGNSKDIKTGKPGLNEIKDWCYRQVSLINSLCEIRDFSDEVMFTSYRKQDLRRVQIFSGIEKISSALDIPITEVRYKTIKACDKQVVCNGVTFFQMVLVNDDDADDTDDDADDTDDGCGARPD